MGTADKKGTEDRKVKHGGRRTPVRRFAAVLAVIPVLAVLSAACLFLPVMAGEPHPDPGAAGWMGRLSGGALISEINLPGTHDSGARFVDLPFFCQCQAYDIKTQLELGYRFLDIRLIEDGAGGLNLCHGGFLCRTGPFPWSEPLGLERVLEWCYSFLAEHPSETIVFLAKNESGNRSDEEIRELLSAYIDRDPERWYLGNRVPALEEARGRLILANRMRNAEGGVTVGMAFLWEDQGNRNPAGSPEALERMNDDTVLHVQDRYCFDAGDKKEAVAQTLKSSSERPPVDAEKHVVLNYLSTKGRLPVGRPLHYAKKLNAILKEQGLERGRRYGWIIVDFGDQELSRIVYESNF